MIRDGFHTITPYLIEPSVRQPCGLLALTGMILLVTSCDREGSAIADKLFIQGKVYTLNEAQPWAEAVAVKGNRIVLSVARGKGGLSSRPNIERWILKNVDRSDQPQPSGPAH